MVPSSRRSGVVVGRTSPPGRGSPPSGDDAVVRRRECIRRGGGGDDDDDDDDDGDVDDLQGEGEDEGGRLPPRAEVDHGCVHEVRDGYYFIMG